MQHSMCHTRMCRASKRQTVENSKKKWPSAERESAKINIEKNGIWTENHNECAGYHTSQ